MKHAEQLVITGRQQVSDDWSIRRRDETAPIVQSTARINLEPETLSLCRYPRGEIKGIIGNPRRDRMYIADSQMIVEALALEISH